ncbi:hypothetical protein FNH05_31150, partial [Amycolatopsis rhizosphaerae]
VQIGAAVAPKSVTVYNPDGDGDNTSRAKYAVDGDPSTIWRTDQYRQQFPTIKHGVGLLASFAQPIKLARVTIAGASQGTVVEIRVADSADPDLAATRVVGTATLSSASTDVTLPQPQPGQYFIVWISQLSGSAGKYQSQIGELTFLPAQ